ncbi:MAG: hypothetical protein IT352_13730 [Gemmatimonadales bacterium]|nr:hypothetical protein [Gemmatimonadales bacterium]
MRIPLICLLTLSLTTAGQAQSRFAKAINIGTVDSIWSATLKENRPYLVYTPPSYDDTTSTPQKYPVLYLLDGDAHFHSVTGLIQILGTGVNGTYAIPEMIVVAIPNTDRSRDMTPTHVETGFDGKPSPFFKTTGGMGNFFTFLKSELIPKIEGKYRTMPYRVFVGHSLGGITAINALYTIPETFNAYIAIDPSLWWDNKTLLKQAKTFITGAKLDGKALYVAKANTMSPDDTTGNPHYEAISKFNAVMEAYNRSGLRYGYKYYEKDDHGSVPLIAEYDAFRFIFDGYKVDLGRVLANPRHIVDHYREVSTRLGATFMPSEGALNMLGQIALTQDTTKAIQFFEVGAELYPASFRPHDRLGAIFMARGDKAKARAHFEHSLTRNVNNPKTRELLTKLGQ